MNYSRRLFFSCLLFIFSVPCSKCCVKRPEPDSPDSKEEEEGISVGSGSIGTTDGPQYEKAASHSSFEKFWRDDGKCGPKNKLPSGHPAGCKFDFYTFNKPTCCSKHGFCGSSRKHCSRKGVHYGGVAKHLPVLDLFGRSDDPTDNHYADKRDKDIIASATNVVIKNITADVKANVSNDINANVTNDVITNVTNNVVSNATDDAVENLTSDVMANVTNKVISNITNDAIGEIEDASKHEGSGASNSDEKLHIFMNKNDEIEKSNENKKSFAPQEIDENVKSVATKDSNMPQ